MSRKNIILTLWLIAPLATFAGLYAMIFVTLDNDKPMSDAAPIGAGAGDTGNANALGQWLAGRDPDAVSLATKAKRERLMISPMDWPGGVELRLTVEDSSAIGHGILLKQVARSGESKTTYALKFIAEEMSFIACIESGELALGDRFYVGKSIHRKGPGTPYTDDQGNELVYISLSPVIPPIDLGVNDPLPVLVPIDSVYADTSGSP